MPNAHKTRPQLIIFCFYKKIVLSRLSMRNKNFVTRVVTKRIEKKQWENRKSKKRVRCWLRATASSFETEKNECFDINQTTQA
jgi:hypothetical protein